MFSASLFCYSAVPWRRNRASTTPSKTLSRRNRISRSPPVARAVTTLLCSHPNRCPFCIHPWPRLPARPVPLAPTRSMRSWWWKATTCKITPRAKDRSAISPLRSLQPPIPCQLPAAPRSRNLLFQRAVQHVRKRFSCEVLQISLPAAGVTPPAFHPCRPVAAPSCRRFLRLPCSLGHHLVGIVQQHPGSAS